MFFKYYLFSHSINILNSRANTLGYRILTTKTFMPLQVSKKLRSFKSIKDKVNYEKRQIELVSCENIYKNWRHTKKYFKVPKGPLKFTIEYIDTDPLFEKCKYCALALHGMPGDYSVFSHLINNFEKHGIRIVVPNFPDSHCYPYADEKLGMGLFRQSSEEKVEILKDFLKELKIDKLDMVIAHSSGIYPALSLGFDGPAPVPIGSFVFFNVGTDIPVKSMKPYFVTYLAAYLSITHWGYRLLMVIGNYCLKYLGYPIRDDNFHGILMLALTMTYTNISKVKAQLEEVRKSQIPVLYLMSENDQIVEQEASLRNCSHLGLDPATDIWHLDEEGNLLFPAPISTGNPMVKAISFVKGSHYVFRKYPEITLEEIIKFFQSHVLNEALSQAYCQSRSSL